MVLLVMKLWLVEFDMWDHQCKLLHKNDPSNNMTDFNGIDLKIRILLQMNTHEFLHQESRPFHITDASIFSKTVHFVENGL